MRTGSVSSSVEDELFARARAGDDAVWGELLNKCYPKVARAVRRRLTPPLRSVFDSTDFASDVIKSLVAKAGRFDFDSFDALVGFLVHAAQQKVVDEYRKACALKRGGGSPCATLDGDDPDGGPLAVASDDPTPSQEAVAGEVHEWLYAGQSEPNREVIELKEAGYTCNEIAEQTGWNLRKVQRFFKGLHESYVRASGRAH
jgi:DNA-directed RNA polymerase specialized sigma24 family protein